jgi:transcriptional repressor NrdR
MEKTVAQYLSGCDVFRFRYLPKSFQKSFFKSQGAVSEVSNTMKCPFCQNENIKVIDSRDVHHGRAIRRRRQCEKCRRRFTTYEEIEVLRIAVKKRDGSHEEYDREKIRRGIERSCEKRPISVEQIERILADIEFAIHSRKKEAITSRFIGEMVLRNLRDVDEVAYVRFASVYKSFGSAKRFEEEIRKLGDT